MTRTRLTPDQLRELDAWDRQVQALGSAKYMARKFGVSESSLSQARSRLRAKRPRHTSTTTIHVEHPQ